jgi:two-component system alkaline phosphatase synthesis response regulator PhoP
MNNEHYSVVVVDHDPVSGPATSSALQAAGFECSLMNDADLALKQIPVIKPHLVLMDLIMPVYDGIDICIELRKMSDLNNLLIVFYSERAEDYSQIAAFNAGADDYIIRPVKARVLVTRLKAILKRYATSASDPLSPKPGLLIDRERYLITMDGEEIILPRKEFELLALLFSSPRKVFTRKEISQLIWGYEFFSRNRTIDVHIRKLREKLGEKYIKTIKGIGYSLEL